MRNIAVHDSFVPALRKEDITALERQLGTSLPHDYKEFLLAHNGGRPEPNEFPISGYPLDDHGIISWFLGVHEGEYNDLVNHIRVFRNRVPPNLLPIGRDPFGNLICLSLSGPDRGKVYWWFHEEEVDEGEIPTYDNVYFVADSFSDLLNNLTELPNEDEEEP